MILNEFFNLPQVFEKDMAEGSAMSWIVYRQDTTLYPNGERDHETEVVKTFNNDQEAEDYANKLNAANRDDDVYYFVRGKQQGVAEAVWDRHSQSHIPRDGRTFGQTNHPREEHCDSCGAPTGHAGPGEDSNVDDNGNVYCDDCYADEQGVAEGSGKNVVKSVKVGNFRHDLVNTGMGWQVRIYNGDELYDTGLSKNSEEKGLAALDNSVAYTKKQLNIKEQGVAEGSGGNWYIRVNGKILNDTKYKPEIFSSEDEARSHAMKLADKKRIPLSQIKLTKSWMDAPEQGVAEGLSDTQKKIEDTILKLEQRLKFAKTPEQWDNIKDRIERLQAGLNRSKQGVAEGFGVNDLRDGPYKEGFIQGIKTNNQCNPPYPEQSNDSDLYKRGFYYGRMIKRDKEQDVAEGAPIATTPDSIDPGGATDNFKQQMANNTEIAYQKKLAGVAEAKDDYVPPQEANYDEKYQAMVRRVGEKAKQQEKARQQPPKAPVRESRLALLRQIIQS